MNLFNDVEDESHRVRQLGTLETAETRGYAARLKQESRSLNENGAQVAKIIFGKLKFDFVCG